MVYKIIFNMDSPIVFYETPVLDSLITWCLSHQTFLKNNQFRKLNYTKEEFIEIDIDIVDKHRNGYYLCSSMFYDENKKTNFSTKWVKKWENKYDELVDFEGRTQKIRIDGGKFKSYNIPINCHSINKVWFYFQSKEPNKVINLLNDNLIGIGKKVDEGWGWIKEIQIEESNKDFDKELLRPIPIRFFDEPPQNSIKKYNGWKPPYWLYQNQELCYVPIGVTK